MPQIESSSKPENKPTNDEWRNNLRKLERFETLADGIRFRNEHMPETLYRYRAFSEYFWKSFPIVRESFRSKKEEVMATLWLTSPNEFNDPFDTWIPYNIEKIIGFSLIERKEIIIKDVLKICITKYTSKKKKQDLYIEIEGAINSSQPVKSLFDIIDKYHHFENKELAYTTIISHLIEGYYASSCKDFGVACFSEVNDNMLMWNNYAGNHSGVCFAYDKSGLLNNRSAELSLFPVLYEDNLPDFGDLIYDGGGVELARMINLSVHTKNKAWSYEKEWRLSLPLRQDLKSENYIHEIPFILPSSIFMGAKISFNERDRVLRFAKLANITVYQMMRKYDEYKLEPYLVFEAK